MLTRRISIPYGAIKSCYAYNQNTTIKIISIPYGAIKSYFNIIALVILIKISIPYGAIKSKIRYGYKHF